MYFWVILALKHLIFEGPAAFGTMHSEIFKTPKLTDPARGDLVLNQNVPVLRETYMYFEVHVRFSSPIMFVNEAAANGYK